MYSHDPLFDPPFHGGRTGAEQPPGGCGHRALYPPGRRADHLRGWTPLMPFWIPAPHAKRAGNWLTLRRWTHRGLSVCALLDASQFPAPSAWVARLPPPTAPPALLGVLIARRRPAVCRQLSCGSHRPHLGGWGRPRVRRLSWRRAPRFARLPWPLHQQGWHSYPQPARGRIAQLRTDWLMPDRVWARRRTTSAACRFSCS